MTGILRIAFELLVNDRGKFAALLVGITFAVLLMVQMTSMFAGVLDQSSATVTNVGATVWVMDPSVKTVADNLPMPSYVLDAVRSIDDVSYAVPLYLGSALVKLENVNYQAANVLGLDDTTLFGRPEFTEGRIEDIYGENAFIAVRDTEFTKLNNPKLGTEFEVNDHRSVVVGIAKVASSGLFGTPALYQTYSKAIQYIPSSRFTMSYVLLEPKEGEDVAKIKTEVARLGYLALTKEEFVARISDFYKFQTGVGTNIMLMTVISFIVGLSISGQIFYTFILENLEKSGALKAIVAKGYELVAMILFQATFTALTGYGLGIGLCTLLIAVAKLRMPSCGAMITYENLALALAMVIVIAGISSYIGVRRVLRIEPFDAFRG